MADVNSPAFIGGTQSTTYTNPAWANQFFTGSGTAGPGGTPTGGLSQMTAGMMGTGPGSVNYNIANWNAVIGPDGQPMKDANGQVITNDLTGEWNQGLQAGYDATVNIDPATGLPRQAGYVTAGTDAYGKANTALGGVGTQLGTLSGAVPNATSWNAGEQQQFMNPYLQGAQQATVDESNRNLFETIMPGVNSTFTGAGQFGSTRNSEFMNRAIQGQQSSLTENIGKLNYGAQTEAAKQYSDWANKGLAGITEQRALAEDQGKIALNQADVAGKIAALGSEDIKNKSQAGQDYLKWQNEALGATYKDYQNQLAYGQDSLKNLTAAGSAIKGNYTPDQTQAFTPNPLTNWQKAAIAAQMAGSVGGKDGTLSQLQKLWDQLFPST